MSQHASLSIINGLHALIIRQRAGLHPSYLPLSTQHFTNSQKMQKNVLKNPSRIFSLAILTVFSMQLLVYLVYHLCIQSFPPLSLLVYIFGFLVWLGVIVSYHLLPVFNTTGLHSLVLFRIVYMCILNRKRSVIVVLCILQQIFVALRSWWNHTVN